LSLKVAVLAPINKVNFDAGEIILFIMTDQKSEMRSVGSTNDVISIGLTESELTQLASDIGLSMGVLRLSPIERGRLCNNIVRGLRSLAVHDINAAPYISLFVYLGQTNKIDAQSRQLDVHPIHLLSRQLIDQPIPELSQSTAIQCLALGAKLYINTWLHRELFDTHLAHGLQQLYSSKRPEWRQLREIDLVDAAAVKNTSDKSDSNTVNQFAKRLYSFLGTGLPDVASLRVGLRSKKTPDLSQGRGDSKQLNDPAVAKTSPDESTATVKEPDDITPDFDLFTKQIKRNLHQDLVDGNRLPIRWGRLNVLESKAAIDKLNRALFNKSSDPLSKRKRYHAATRYLSIFCGLSLKTVLRLPLAKRDGRGRGSMHVNIHGGFLRRDQQCIAPRSKKSVRNRYTGKWWRSYLPKEVVEVLIEMFDQFPQSKTIGDLIHAFGLDHELCQHFLNDGWPSSHLPEDARLAQSLRVILLNLEVHPQVVAQFTGDTMTTPSSDHYYLALPQSKLFDALDKFCSWAGLTAPTRPKQDKRIGSPNVVSKEKMGDLMAALNQRVLAARNMVTTRSDIDDVVKFHNIYAPAIALQTLWGVGGRGNLLSKNSFERLFSSEEFLIIADRRLDRYTRARIVPSTKPITDGRTNFIEHLFSLSSRLEKSKCQCASYVQQAASGKLPHKSAFFILVRTGDEWSIRDLNRQDLTSLIVELAKEVGLSLTGDDINLGRHFWYTILVEMGVAEVAIEALLGHHIPGSEPFAYGSGVSVREVCDYLAPIMETVHAAIGLNAIQGLGRTAERFKNLPTMPVPKNLRALPNLLLQTKLKAQNFEIREVPVIDADPPIDSKSLICHSYLNQLHERYLASNSLRDKPKGSLLFCLIAFDLVLSEVELKALFLDALNCGPFKVGQIVALEAQQDGRPMVQRLVSTYTTDALDLARREAFDNPHHAYEAARVELHKLIQTLASDWSPKTGDESAKHLAMIASHWAAIEVPQGTLYGVFHKAPILPVGDIARVYYGQPRIGMPAPPTPRKYSGKIDRGFKQILDIVKDFADKDHVHGNDDTRSKDCVNQLRTGQRDGTLARDFVDDAFIDMAVSSPKCNGLVSGSKLKAVVPLRASVRRLPAEC
jgi:hypothetical protein